MSSYTHSFSSADLYFSPGVALSIVLRKTPGSAIVMLFSRFRLARPICRLTCFVSRHSKAFALLALFLLLGLGLHVRGFEIVRLATDIDPLFCFDC